MTKIALIGAGSVVFAKNLLSDILQFPALRGVTISLMDIDPNRLKVALVMTERIIAKLEVPAKVSATLDRREAIKGASYVICTIQVGGYRPSTVLDFDIPTKYGLRQTIADTLGVGGVFRGLRTIPKILEIARDIADVGKDDCLLLNYTNPMAMLCWSVDKAVGIPHIGLCHSVQGTSRLLASFAGIPYEQVRYKVAGINHMAFFLKFEYRGQDAYPLLFRALEDPDRKTELVRFEMMRRLGYFVTESSDHQSEYIPYFIQHGEEMVDQFKISLDEYKRRSEAIISTWKDSERTLVGNDDDIEVRPMTFEYGARIVNARETNEATVVYGNIPNRGVISNLPTGCCVEGPVVVDGMGLQPTVIGDLPPQLASIIRSNVNVQELTVEAALSGKREHIYHAVMMDPNASSTLSLDAIWKMCDELIDVHQKNGYLGEFSAVVPNTGRAAKGIVDRSVVDLRLGTAFDNQVGGETDLEATVWNPSDEPVSLALSLELPESDLECVGASTVKIEAGPKANAEVRFKVRTKSVVEGVAQVWLSADSDNVLCGGLRLKPRKRIARDDSGKAGFSLDLSGVPAVEGRFFDLGEYIGLEANVADSNLVEGPSDNGLLEHSGLRCFVSRLSGESIKEVFVHPDSKNQTVRLLDREGKRLAKSEGSFSQTDLDYTFSVKIPKESIGLKEDDSGFLLQIHAVLGALGDAHSGGKATLVNQFAPWSRNESFAEVTL